MNHSKWLYRGKPSNVSAKLIAEHSRFHGIVYVAKLPDGVVKIGSTRTPKKRTQALKTTFKVFSESTIEEVAISQPCTDYKSLERALHSDFADVRIRGELFGSSIDQVGVLLFKKPLTDDSERMDEEARRRNAKFLPIMKSALTSEKKEAPEKEYDFDRLCDVPRLISELSAWISGKLDVANPGISTEEHDDSRFRAIRNIFIKTTMEILGPDSRFVEIRVPNHDTTFIDLVLDIECDLGEAEIVQVFKYIGDQ